MVWAEDPETGEKELKRVVQTFVREVNQLVYVYVDGQIIETTGEHPFWVVGQGWTEAALLKAGDLLKLENGKTLPVEKIEFEQLTEPVKVYNFEVEDFHTYYVGENSILVHNANYNYTDKVLGQKDKYHSFPTLIDGMGSSSTIIGGDGIARTKIQAHGSINGVDGYYTWIIDPNGSCNHRFFEVY